MVQRSKALLLSFLLVGSVSSWGQDPFHFQASDEQITRISHSKGWLRLLHYRAPFLRSPRSNVVNEGFFLAREGKTDPRQELEATLRTVLDPVLARESKSAVKQPAICAFSARVAFLSTELGSEFVKALPTVECPDFEEWRKGISAKSVSVVYSSAYPNNPASMFGHTLLRLDRKAGGGESLTKQTDLFSYGVNFSAAVPEDENSVRYALWGLFGGYYGRYDLSPYYRKVNEYAFSENRDLWEYRLNFSEAETDQLVRHLWELYSGGVFKYYFLDENCSYQILTALEAVKPDWNVSNGFILTVIPIETVKHLAEQAGMVEAVNLRPSLRARMERAAGELSSVDRARLQALFLGKEPLSVQDSAPVLDALILALNHEKGAERNSYQKGELLKSVLAARSKLAIPTAAESDAHYPKSKRPDLSHGTSRVTLSGGEQTAGAFLSLSFSGFEHDFLNRIHSFNPFSEVRVLKLGIEKREALPFRVRGVRILEMASFAPYSIFDPQKSWRLGVGWSRVEDRALHTGGAWKVDGGYGFGYELLSSTNLVYLLGATEIETGGGVSSGTRFSPGGELGFILNPVEDRYFLYLKALLLHDLTGESGRRMRWSLHFSQAYAFAENWDLRLNLSRFSYSEGSASFGSEGSLALSIMY